jgi:hypothetical protein
MDKDGILWVENQEGNFDPSIVLIGTNIAGIPISSVALAVTTATLP